MQSTSVLYRQILSIENHWFETKAIIAGKEYGEDALMNVSSSAALYSGNPEIGKAVAGEISLTAITNGNSIPRMAKVQPYVRACGEIAVPHNVSTQANTIDLDNGSSISAGVLSVSGAEIEQNVVTFTRTEYRVVRSEWIPKGTYYIDTRDASRNNDGLDVLKIHGYDAMLFAEQEYEGTKLTWPATDINVVKEIASKIGVPVDGRTTELMKSGYVIPLPSGYTLREVLGYIASMYVGSFVITETGNLLLISMLGLPPETNYLVDNAGDAIVFGAYRILV